MVACFGRKSYESEGTFFKMYQIVIIHPFRKLLWCTHFLFLSAVRILGSFCSYFVIFLGIYAPVFQGFKVQKRIIMESRMWWCSHFVDISAAGILGNLGSHIQESKQ